MTTLAGNLAYVSLLSLVPLVAVIFALFSAFPMFADVSLQLRHFVCKLHSGHRRRHTELY